MYFFGDSFDLYALPADALLGYWDSGTTSATLGAGRFSGSRAWTHAGASGSAAILQKNSTSNDAIHHLVLAVSTASAITGTTIPLWFTFMDSGTAQCSLVFRMDGAILLQSGTVGGTTLATYTGALTASNTWYAFEIEVVINNTTGSIAIRKNGNTSNDFSATSLNTRGGTANNYANQLKTGQSNNIVFWIDDLLWRSDSTAPTWVGDIRCYTRRPDTDASVQWTRPGTFQMQPYFGSSAPSGGPGLNLARFTSFISQGGAIGSVIVNFASAMTGNIKCAIYAASAGQPTTVVQAATAPINNPPIGANTFTFSPAVSITKGSQFFVALGSDTNAVTSMAISTNVPYSTAGFSCGMTYASFPVANPTGLSAIAAYPFFPVVTPAANADAVSESYEDAAASYVYSSTVGQSDLYSLTGIDSTPTSIVGVTTRGLLQKSDAGTRNVAVQLKSGGTTVESASAALNTTWGHIYRVDTVDPATGAAWTPTGVNNLQIGCVVKA